MDMRSPLGRARGLGSAHEGPHHWWHQKVSSIALVPLTFWFAFSVIGLVGADYGAYRAWISEYGNLVLMILFVATAFHHAQLGAQIVMEDYLEPHWLQVTGIIFIKFFAVFGAVACITALVLVATRG